MQQGFHPTANPSGRRKRGQEEVAPAAATTSPLTWEVDMRAPAGGSPRFKPKGNAALPKRTRRPSASDEDEGVLLGTGGGFAQCA